MTLPGRVTAVAGPRRDPGGQMLDAVAEVLTYGDALRGRRLDRMQQRDHADDDHRGDHDRP